MSSVTAAERAATSRHDSDGFSLRELSERYRILAKLGAGGMADVFLAVQADGDCFERFVVVKRMRAISEPQLDSARMFMNEARVVASLNHPHIVKVFDLGRLDSDIAFAMEYIDGESLETLCVELKRKGGQIPIPIALKLMIEAAEALHYAHSARATDGSPLNLIHRDIGPQNLLLTSHGYLKVIDFGVAKSAAQLEVTTPGLIKGKIPYFAPESLTGPTLDGRADLYSLGLVMFELLTLKRAHPFAPDAPIAEVVRRITSIVLPPVSAVDPNIPKPISQVVSQATRIDRRKRFQTGAEFAAAIRKAADLTSGIATTAEVEAWFRETFVERQRVRRAFERRALAGSSAPLGQVAIASRAAVSKHIETGSQPSKAGTDHRKTSSSRILRPIVLLTLTALGLGIIGGAIFGLLSATQAPSVQSAETETSGVVYMDTDNLFVESDPPGANVFIDGHPVGNTGETGLNLRLTPSREHEVVVSRKGFLDYRLQLTGETFGQRQIRAELAASPRALAERSARSRASSATGARKRGRGLERPKQQRPIEKTAPVPGTKRPIRETKAPPPGKAATVNTRQFDDILGKLDQTEQAVPTLTSIPMPPPPPPMVESNETRATAARPAGPVKQSMAELISRRIKGQAPEYPRAQLERGLSSSVDVFVEISAAGKVVDYEFKGAPSTFTRAVERALPSWQFEPHTVEGRPVATSGQLRIEFQIK